MAKKKLTTDQAEALDALVDSGRCTKEDLGQFDEHELFVLANATLEYLDKGESLTIKSIEASDYKFEVPNITNFVLDSNYLGNELGYLKDVDGSVSKKRQIYDYWLEQLDAIYNKGKVFTEVLITGAIGIGKTTVMDIIQLYDLMHLLALKNPQLHYGLMPSTVIVLAFFNILKDLATDVGYTQFQNIMDSSPFFRKSMYYNSRLREGLRWMPPHGSKLVFRVGSRVSHTLGVAVFGAQMDEANFGGESQDRTTDEKRSQVYANYTHLLRRKESRFMFAPGHFCIGSSKRSTADFLEKHIDSQKGKPGVYVIDAAQYEVKRGTGQYSGKMFRVLLGDLTREPRILLDKEEIESELLPSVKEIPIEHKKAYEDDIIEALRDISGVAAQPKQALYTNRDAIRSAITARKPPWKYTSEKKSIPNTVNISFYGKDQISDYLIKDLLLLEKDRLPYKNNPRFLSIDTGYAASGDAGGISMGCRAGVKMMERLGLSGENEKYFIPKYWMDFAIRIRGKKGEEFPLYKFTEFVRFLIEKMDIELKGMSTDGFQSVQLRQDLKIAFPSMDVQLLSVDRDDAAHINLRNTIYGQALAGMYMDDNLLTELFDLVHIAAVKKQVTRDNLRRYVVDHPVIASDGFIGRKDVADSLAAMLFICRELDTSISSDEVDLQTEQLRKIDIDAEVKKAEEEADQAIKEIDALKLDELFK